MIVFAQGTYGERVDQTLECVRRVRGHVDRIVIIVDQTICENDRQRIRDLGAEVHYRKWNDNFPEMRNHYLNLCKNYDWICVSDPDEWYCEKLCKDLRALTTEVDKRKLGTALFVNSHDIWHDPNGSIRANLKSSFYKKLILKKLPRTRYNGVGTAGNVHEHLSIPGESHHQIEDKYFYEHHKYDHEVWERAGRNVFIGGGGDNMGHRNPSWRKLRQIANSLGIRNWTTMRDYMRKGNIDQRLKQWLVDNSRDTNNYEHEMMEFGKWYFEYLHREENNCGWSPRK